MRRLLAVSALQIFVLYVAFGQRSLGECRERYEREIQANPGKSLPHFELGVCYMEQKDRAKAVNEFHNALNGDAQPPWVVVWSHLNRGKLFDTTGQRERTLREYRIAERTGDNTRGALDEVRRFKEIPYKEK